MNGLTSSAPSQSAMRLTGSGIRLMRSQCRLLLRAQAVGDDAGMLSGVLTTHALSDGDAVVSGSREPPEGHWGQRHGR